MRYAVQESATQDDLLSRYDWADNTEQLFSVNANHEFPHQAALLALYEGWQGEAVLVVPALIGRKGGGPG